ncbi:50S ribosomal protein L37ae [Candidatus Pacearchaeota archaeon]|nr:50S ribosomal protein L37ae [Candidatus Pacearchaeota archaeon]
MGAKTKKIKAAGKFGAGYGVRVRNEYNALEAVQRKRQASPFYPKGRVKRIAAGIWRCMKTGRVFAGNAYILDNKK